MRKKVLVKAERPIAVLIDQIRKRMKIRQRAYKTTNRAVVDSW